MPRYYMVKYTPEDRDQEVSFVENDWAVLGMVTSDQTVDEVYEINTDRRDLVKMEIVFEKGKLSLRYATQPPEPAVWYTPLIAKFKSVALFARNSELENLKEVLEIAMDDWKTKIAQLP